MGELVFKGRIAVPGDLLARGLDFLPGKGTFRLNEEIRSKTVGLVKVKNKVVAVIPLAGIYSPRVGDRVIGQIKDVQVSFWLVDINSPYLAFLGVAEGTDEFVELGKTDLTRYYDVGDLIHSVVISVSKRKDVKLTMRERICIKLQGGCVIKIAPTRVPRLIGREGSMINLIKGETGCQIRVGQNGLVWIRGDKERLAVNAIRMVERESHLEGLTERIKAMLTKGQTKGD